MRVFVRWLVLLAALPIAGCAGGGLAVPQRMPHEAEVRRISIGALAERLFAELRGGDLSASLATTRELDVILAPEARLRFERERAGSRGLSASLSVLRRDWAALSYVGFCAQGAREEPAHGALGLAQEGWILERILLVGHTGPHGPRSASWLEGDFVYTALGWKALNVRRIEAPRRQHADLELAPCDVEAGLR